MAICSIPPTIRNENLSLHDAIDRSGFREVRGRLAATDLAGYLAEHPEVAKTWIGFSEDKRTKSGWALTERDGRWKVEEPFPDPGPPGAPSEFDDRAEACATYILNELDYWVGVADRRSKRT